MKALEFLQDLGYNIWNFIKNIMNELFSENHENIEITDILKLLIKFKNSKD